MSRTPYEIAGFTALPIHFPPQTSFPTSAKHYIYLKPHDPKFPDQDASRSLFLVNIPITTTELHLRDLFGTKLLAGRVERVDFSDHVSKPSKNASIPGHNRSKKRKRVNAEELELELSGHQVPEVWDSTIQSSGAHAVVVFVDRPSMEASLKAAKKSAKAGARLVWGGGIEDKIPPLGLQRYLNHHKLSYPARQDLLLSVDAYMTAYSQMEQARSRENAKKRQVPDEDGFVTVTKGARGGIVRKEDAKELGEKQKEKGDKGLEDFYRFQMREKRKEQQGDLLRKFEEDKRKVDEMRKRRGRLRPE